MNNITQENRHLTMPSSLTMSSSDESFQSPGERIWQNAKRTPALPAIVSKGKEVSYLELMVRSEAIARELESNGNGESGRVLAICTKNTVQFIIAALGAWRAGWAYVPLDPDAPSDRLNHMLAESNANCLAVSKSTLRVEAKRVLLLDEITDLPIDLSSKEVEQPTWNIGPRDLAYVIYTSGTRGQPKGAAISHGNLESLIRWYLQAFDVTAQDRASQIVALTFDVSAIEIWPHLAVGACVYAFDRDLLYFPERLRDHLAEQAITLCQIPALIAEQLLSLEWPAHTKLRYMHTGGETLHILPPPVLPFQVVNNYGVTECTVVSTSIIIPRGGQNGFQIPAIGRPITGTEILICDTELRTVAPGERGEIVIAGAGVGLGYINRADLTRERFIGNELAEEYQFYRTGDLGRLLPDGQYEFCGRRDDQIKLRGHRIEPAEIAFALRSHPKIGNCAIVARGQGAAKQLVAYIVLRGQTTAADLRTHLATRLPTYMIPDCFVPIDVLLATAHGKIDFEVLPAPTRSNILDIVDEMISPTRHIQTELVSILSKLLRVPELGINDNVFRLGANSLLVTQIIARVQHAFHVNLSLRTVFDNPSAAALTIEIENRILESSAIPWSSENPLHS